MCSSSALAILENCMLRFWTVSYTHLDLAQDLSGLLAPHWDENLRAHTDFTCPDLSIIGPEYITGYITEVGIVPGTAMFGVAREYAAKLEKGEL